MLYDYQCCYAKDGEARTVLVRADSPGAAAAIMERIGITATVGPGEPVVDWSKPTLTKEEACVYLGIGETKLWELQCAGELPRPKKNGHSVFHVRELERYRAKAMRVQEWEGRAAA